MIQIAVIGCGIVGSRHAQALGLLDLPCAVFLVDPSSDARQRATDLLTQELIYPGLVRIEPMEALDALPSELDVVVVATNAQNRRQVVERLLSRARVRHLVLEKFLFQRLADYDAVGTLLEHTATRAWVNCPRRMWPGYRDLRKELSGPVGLDVATHARYGIGTSAIHLLDILAYLSCEGDFTLSAGGVDPRPIDHRGGGIELTGTLSGHASRGSFFRFTAYAEGVLPPLIVIDSPSLRAIIDEGRQQMRISRADEDWAWREETFATAPQSRLTDKVVRALLNEGTCPLPDYAQSARLHLAILEPLLKHYRAHVQQGAEACPIT